MNVTKCSFQDERAFKSLYYSKLLALWSMLINAQTPCINYYPYYVILCRKWSEIPSDNLQNETRGSETRFKMEKEQVG